MALDKNEKSQIELTGSISKPSDVAESNIDLGFLINLWEGNFGLPMTYWGYGVLGGFAWITGVVALSPQKDSDLESLVYFLMLAYYVVIYVAIWRAASKFKGARIWAVLAKFVVVIVTVPTAIRVTKWLILN